MKKSVLPACLALFCAQGAFAATYEFSETFAGSFMFDSDGSPFVRLENSSLVPEASTLPSWLATEFQQTVFSYDGGRFRGRNANGSYQGTFEADSYNRVDSTNVYDFDGSFTFTGGTGVFAGLSGGGTMTGSDTYLSGLYGSTVRTFTGTITLPVPEPETWALLGAGLALVVGAARRTRTG